MDPFAPLVTALTHPGFPMARPAPKNVWLPLLSEPAPTAEELAERLRHSADSSVQEALQRLDEVGEELLRLREQGVFALTWLHEAYPSRWRERLGAKAPPVVFGVGPLSILESRALAVLGSRAASEAALDFAAACGREAVIRGYAVASGGAKGVDLEAVQSACEAGGTAVVISADALHELHRRLLKSGCEADQVLALTPYHPDSGFSVGQAMGRNKLVYGLAEAAVIVACEKGSGGTWSGAVEALKNDWCPVLAWTGKGSPEGNRELTKERAVPIEGVAGAFETRPAIRTQETLF